MKLRVIILYGLHQPLHHDSRYQLFPYFTFQSFLWSFTQFHLSTWEFPAVLIVAISSLGGEDTPLFIVYNCCYDFYLFHHPTAIFWAT